MSKKTTTDSSQNTSFQFSPEALKAYTQNLGQFLPFAQSLYQNPYGNQMFQQENSIGQDQAARLGQRNMSNIVNNSASLGYSTTGGAFNEMLSNASRATSGMQANAFRSAVLNANQRAMTGLGVSAGFQPLLTGSNSKGSTTTTTGGLGSWLPQLAGGALGAGLGAFTGGGASKLFSGSASGAGAGVGATGSGMGAMFGGIGNVMSGGGGGYGYGSNGFNPQGGFMNPFMFGGR